jgi:serine/threonine protein kinase
LAARQLCLGADLLPQRTPAPPAGAALQAAMRQLKGEIDTPAEAPRLAVLLGEPWHGGKIGPYEVHEVIGRGGMGVVLRGYDAALDRPVAIKVLSPQLAAGAAARRRFAREGKAIAAVRHEHIVTVYAVDEAEGLPCLVMEYVAGVSLQQRVDTEGPLPTEEIIRVGAQAARGLEAAHSRGLVHRDVKPANILLEEGTNRVKLTDFGLARAVDDAGLTSSGVVNGTPLYMSPEQARDEPLDARADLFSLGSVLYTLATGEAAFHASSTPAVLRRICDETPRPVREVNPAVPQWLATLIAVLHAKHPAHRIGSAGEVARLLESYREHRRRPDQVPPPPLPPLPKTTPPGRNRLGSIGALLLAALLGAAGASAFRSQPARSGGRPACRAVPAQLAGEPPVATSRSGQAIRVAVVGSRHGDATGAVVVVSGTPAPATVEDLPPGCTVVVPPCQQPATAIPPEEVEKGLHWWNTVGARTVRVLLEGMTGKVRAVLLPPCEWRWKLSRDGAGGFVLWPLPSEDGAGQWILFPT